MKTLYQSKGAVKVAELSLGDGHAIRVVLTNEPIIIDRIVCEADRMPERKLTVLYCGNNGSWSTDQEWSASHPESGSGDIPCGHICAACHEPVMGYIAMRNPNEIRHIRQNCGCTMLLMDQATLPWWSELSSEEAWNELVVGGAKQAHKRFGL
jgi:hypothetical protein